MQSTDGAVVTQNLFLVLLPLAQVALQNDHELQEVQNGHG